MKYIDPLFEGELVDSKGRKVKEGDLVYYSKLRLGAGGVGGRMRINKIERGNITATFWHKRGGKETLLFTENELRGYITIEK